MKFKFLSLVAFVSLIVISCTKDEAIKELASSKEPTIVDETTSLKTTSLIESINSLYFNQEIAKTVDDAMELNDSSTTSKGSTTTSKGTLEAHGGNHQGGDGHQGGSHQGGNQRYMDSDHYGDCAVVTNDTINLIKTIDFGVGCADGEGEIRSGKIIITYSSDQDVIGAFRQIEFVDFFRDSVNIKGTRRIEVIDIDELGNKTTETSLTNGMMIYPDGTFESKSSSIIRYTYIDPDDRRLNYATIEGSENGVNSDASSFNMEITTPILFVNNCGDQLHNNDNTRANGTHQHGQAFQKRFRNIPVQGIMTLTTDTDTIITDFGDGSCDTDAVVTTNGVSETININRLRRNEFFRNLRVRGH